MKRTIEEYIKKDMMDKIILITGPRQVGKTTLSKMISSDFDYLNFDYSEDRLRLSDKSWNRSCKLIIFDEIHKMKNWKSWLKGIYDTENIPPSLLVTGSAKLDKSRISGESMAGRFFRFRLHPLDLKELYLKSEEPSSEKLLEKLLLTGGFPEPYFKETLRFYNRWKVSHQDIIIKQDIPSLEDIKEIRQIETLIQLLRKRSGSLTSYSSLSRDLQCSDKSVKKWIEMLEDMYIIFRIFPFHRNIARSITKTPKIYFYDNAQVIGDEGVKLENLVACALLKESHFVQDCFGIETKIFYLRNRDGKEIDFLIEKENSPYTMIEVKTSDDHPSKNFNYFSKYFNNPSMIQLVKNLKREKTFPNGIEIRPIHKYLSKFSFE